MSGGKRFRQARWDEVNQLKDIWLQSFPEDGEQFWSFFLERWFRPERCVVIENEHELESVAYLFQGEFVGENRKSNTFLYLYAIATVPRYRGQGNLGRILRGCLQLAKEKGYAGLFLTSAPGLEPLYEHYGCKRCADLYSWEEIVPKEQENLTWDECAYEKYAVLREAYLNTMEAAFHWHEESNLFFYEEIWEEGCVLTCKQDGLEYYAACRKQENGWVIQETNHPITQSFMGSLCAALRTDAPMTVYSPTPKDEKAVPNCFGHWMTHDQAGEIPGLEQAYINMIGD